ncbi:thioredoxin reductase [Halarchaeum rubridurum]|uniref:Thioredoxin reductase n=1 Tax=Halarchaeum rubridurum TaxID=489911 RepID=A0A830FMT8_9EURY|nr:FAD-dependent monooxygenase [Halarchaeum rubridurum]MBP1954615.1 thioredoxin reductase [Halarchaeum rubridurum]GGM62494.1 thioredoxin reductase [Halarchaeum rubridurum]
MSERTERDVVVVGGGPSGASTAIFTARYGLDTLVFDRGVAALPRSAFLENYPGFPAGIDIETYRGLLHDHLETAGADLVADTVEAVEHADGDAPATGSADGPTGDAGADDEHGNESGAHFVVTTADGRTVRARHVVAASWYDGDYLRPVVGDDAYESHEHDGESHEHFDGDYPDADGRTDVAGLYVVAPAGQRNAQAVVAAGQGAHVARRLIKDVRLARGYPDDLAEHYDWLRSASEFSGEWAERERWREWFDDHVPDARAGDDDIAALRASYIDAAFETRRDPAAVDDLRERAHDRLLSHLDDERIRAYAAEHDLLDGDGATAAGDAGDPED